MPLEKRPFVFASVAMSLDGFIDDGDATRLVLSNPQDLKARDELRSKCDAILVGANTVRRDNPSLLIDSEELREKRKTLGLSPDLVKITMTRSGNLDPRSKFFQSENTQKLVYCPQSIAAALQRKLAAHAEIIGLEELTPTQLLRDVASRNIRTLMVEGGQSIHTAFLKENAVDELRVAVAPFFVGEDSAPRFVAAAQFSFNKHNHLQLLGVEQLGDVAVLRYGLRPK